MVWMVWGPFGNPSLPSCYDNEDDDEDDDGHEDDDGRIFIRMSYGYLDLDNSLGEYWAPSNLFALQTWLPKCFTFDFVVLW